MKIFGLVLLLLQGALVSFAQTTPCGVAPTPGTPHVCLSWNAVTTNIAGATVTGVTYNVFRSTTKGGENYSTPLNSSPLTTTNYYDTTVAVPTSSTPIIYYYTITAGSGGAQSLPSTEVQAQIPVPLSSTAQASAVAD